MKTKIFLLIIISLILTLVAIYYLAGREKYVNNGADYLKIERNGQELDISPLGIETTYGINRIEYSINNNNIYIWTYKKYYKFLKEKTETKKIKLENNFQYNTYYKNKNLDLIFIGKY